MHINSYICCHFNTNNNHYIVLIKVNTHYSSQATVVFNNFSLSLYSPSVCQDLICDARWQQLSCHNQRRPNDEAPPIETFTVCISGDNKEDHLLLSFVLYCSLSLLCFEFLLVSWQHDVMGWKVVGLGDEVGEGILVNTIFVLQMCHLSNFHNIWTQTQSSS